MNFVINLSNQAGFVHDQNVRRKISSSQFLFVCFASQKYTIVIIMDLQYTYETSRIKVTYFLKLCLHGGVTYK